MKIYFTSTTAEFEKYKDTYFFIQDLLIDKGHILTRDWLGPTESKLNLKQLKVNDIHEIYKDCLRAIREADLVIVEDTVSNFSTGHQITLALQQRKPTLVLWQGKKHRTFNKMFVHGIESDLLEVKEYTIEQIGAIVAEFINKFEGHNEKNRFHLVLNKSEREYLDWLQYHTNKSRTNLIRDALRNKMKKDTDYSQYLSKKR